VCIAVLAGVMARGATAARPLDISQAPLASASNLSVLPNLLFLLDDSGSMMFDTLPDHTERVQGGAERRYWHRNFNCKPKNVKTTGAFAGSLPNHCDRVDPPFGAAQFNGMYYNPQLTYRPPINADGTSLAQQTNWTSVSCDPFSSKWQCKDWYDIENSANYYNSGTLAAKEGNGGEQTYSNPEVKQWYGTGDKFNVQGEWPEIVYCRNGNDKLEDCRRNGLAASGVDTGNPFRYTTARWGAGGGGYPEAEPVHEFYRSGSPSSNTTIIVTTSYPHGLTAGTKITGIRTTGTGLTASTAVAVTVTGPNTFTYTNGGTGRRLEYGNFDLIVNLERKGGLEVTVTRLGTTV
jgi:hypothetical protein